MSSQPERSSQMALYGLHVRGLLLHRPNNPWTVAFVMGLSPSLASSMTASEGSTRAGAWAHAPLQAPRCPGTVPGPCKHRPACTDQVYVSAGLHAQTERLRIAVHGPRHACPLPTPGVPAPNRSAPAAFYSQAASTGPSPAVLPGGVYRSSSTSHGAATRYRTAMILKERRDAE